METQKKFQVDKPYPPVKIVRENPAYARVILDNIGGTISEVSAISLYVYDHMVTKGFEEIADAFHKIAVVEMRHLELFGELALLLGADPRWWTFGGTGMKYWTPSYNTYTLQLPILIKNAIASEQSAIEKYKWQINTIDDQYIVALLERIIQDEELHLEILTGLFEKYKDI